MALSSDRLAELRALLGDDAVLATETARTHLATWNAGDVPHGMYFYRLRAGDRVLTGAVPLVK